MPKGTTLTSYSPTLKDKLAWFLSDTFGGGDRGRVNYINDKVRGAADFAPVLGDLIGVEDTKRALDEGRYGDAALSGATTAVGSIPGLGDAAAAGLKAGGSALGILMGPMSRLYNHDMARKAQDMLENGQPLGRIWTETGSDWNPKMNQWAQEIPDFRARIDPGIANFGYDPSDMYMLDNVLTHPELYDAYPDLRGIGVMEVDAVDPNFGPSYEGAFFSQTPPHLNPWGGLDDADPIAQEMAEEWAAENLPDSMITLRSNPSITGNMPDNRSTALHEIQHAVQAREGWDGGFNPDRAGQVAQQRTDSFPYVMMGKALKEWQADPRLPPVDINRMSQLGKAVLHETYMRNSGEAQARLVQARRDLMPDAVRRLRPSAESGGPWGDFMDRTWAEQLTTDDILNGVYARDTVPGLSLRGPARRIR